MASDNPVITVYHKKDVGSELHPKWWFEDEEHQYRDINAIVKHMGIAQAYRNMSFLRHARLYHNLELLGFNPSAHARVQEYPMMNNRVTFNVVKSCIDTVQSKIASNRPRPMFLTEDGDWSLQTKAKLLTQYVGGLFYDMKVYEKGSFTFRDGEVFGTGILKIYPEVIDEEKKIAKVNCERVLPAELKVDDAEGMYGTPRQMHQTKYMSKDILTEMFPEFEDKIKAAQNTQDNAISFYHIADLIEVTESWHLRSGANTDDGRHCIVIENCTLLSEPYDKDYFPFVFIRWTDRIVGFWGQGLCEELIGIQLEINKLLRLVQMAMHLISNPRIFQESSGTINLQHINNEIGAIIKYTGQKPDFVTPTAIQPEVYQHIENLYHKAYEISGISQLSANSSKPQGLDSGKALREFTDIESDRFKIVGQRYEQFYMDVATIAVDITKDLEEAGYKQDIKTVNGKFVKLLKWKEVNLKDSSYVMKVFPTSMLSKTPSGRLSDVTEMVQAGFIDKDMAQSLLDFPDLEGYESLATASIEMTKRMITLMVEEGKYETPEPEMNLQMAISMCQNAYCKYRNQGLEEDRLELLRRFIQDCKDLQPPAPQPQSLPAPIAVPEPNPQSNLLPIGGQ